MKITDQYSAHQSYVMNRIRSTSSIVSISIPSQRKCELETGWIGKILEV